MPEAGRLTIKDLPAELRPRERLRASGAAALSTAELLAVVIGTGVRGHTALDVGTALLRRFGSAAALGRASAAELARVPGVGEHQAARVLAALELGRRLVEPPPLRRAIRCAADAAALCASMRLLDREHFRAILLNTRHEVLDVVDVSVGGLQSAPVHPREVFKEAIRRSAAAVIVVHNHPSGHPEPSRDDVLITEQLRAAGRLVGIEVLDHIIVGERDYCSLRERQLGFP
ncbi:MAG: DNA repair protein RadC [Armatimonadota bacterium]|nr:DNA repair protein RadC [Armatimonadota bacterium]MDR7402427.1 DNA repair protein RadC [Armatimonadota bacterium]MDR7404233.1 DNA repair protein RadC [Armatimonadota bacterium]MDR7437552.1 DNA repair protein RadC [Armatimonadota bacterium]MDR7472146.1 DNA repair protein RadC [Armatimonadota bacterium]